MTALASLAPKRFDVASAQVSCYDKVRRLVEAAPYNPQAESKETAEWLNPLRLGSLEGDFNGNDLSQFVLNRLRLCVFNTLREAGVSQDLFDSFLRERRLGSSWPDGATVVKVARFVGILPPLPLKPAPVWQVVKYERTGRGGMLAETRIHVYDVNLDENKIEGSDPEAQPLAGVKTGCGKLYRLTRLDEDSKVCVFIMQRGKLSGDEAGWCKTCLNRFKDTATDSKLP